MKCIVDFLNTAKKSSTCLMHMGVLLLKKNVLPEDTAEDRFQQAEFGQQ